MYQTFEKYSTGFGVRLTRGLLFPLLKLVLITFLLYTITVNLFLKSFEVESVSMQPTLTEKERIFVSPLIYGAKLSNAFKRLPGIRIPERGDLVVINFPSFMQPSFAASIFEPLIRFLSLQKGGIVRDPSGIKVPRYMVKRIIGLPGDTVKMTSFTVYIRPEGKKDFLAEHELIPRFYKLKIDSNPENWKKEYPLSGNLEAVTLKEDEYFILGDYRTRSNDSRSWGPLNADRIMGKVFMRYWPIDHSGRL